MCDDKLSPIHPGDVLLCISFARQQLDNPTGKSLQAARDVLDDLEWRLVNDCIVLGLPTTPTVLAGVPI